MKYIVIGAGSRGTIYGSWAHQNGIEIAAVAEVRPDRLAEAGKQWNVPENRLFTDVSQLFALGKIADANRRCCHHCHHGPGSFRSCDGST